MTGCTLRSLPAVPTNAKDASVDGSSVHGDQRRVLRGVRVGLGERGAAQVDSATVAQPYRREWQTA